MHEKIQYKQKGTFLCRNSWLSIYWFMLHSTDDEGVWSAAWSPPWPCSIVTVGQYWLTDHVVHKSYTQVNTTWITNTLSHILMGLTFIYFIIKKINNNLGFSLPFYYFNRQINILLCFIYFSHQISTFLFWLTIFK